MPLRGTQRAAISQAPRMSYSPVPTPEGTKETYWETKAPSSEVLHLFLSAERPFWTHVILVGESVLSECVGWQVLGIGKDVPAASFAAASVISAIIGGYCTAEVSNAPRQPSLHGNSPSGSTLSQILQFATFALLLVVMLQPYQPRLISEGVSSPKGGAGGKELSADRGRFMTCGQGCVVLECALRTGSPRCCGQLEWLGGPVKRDTRWQLWVSGQRDLSCEGGAGGSVMRCIDLLASRLSARTGAFRCKEERGCGSL